MYDFIFYHIPKCGGSTIREYCKNIFLKKGYSINDIYIACEEKGLPNLMDENKLKQVSKILENKKVILSHIHTRLYDRLYSKYTITCIRNPITRFISSFNHFILMDNPDANLEDLFLNYRTHLDTKIGVLYTSTGYFKTIQAYDFIIIFENLISDLNFLREKIGLQTHINIPHEIPAEKNKSNKNYFKLDMYNPIHIKIVEYLKIKLLEDINIYNEICIMRKLNKLIIEK